MSTSFKGHFKSADGINDIAYYVYIPLNDVKGVMQISHGMCEYIQRYGEFIEFLTRRGFVVCGNDHLGHGWSVKTNADLGYFSKERGWQNCVLDLHTMTKIMKKSYNDVPYFMFGHSMGSFLARAYMVKFGYELDGAVISGTAGSPKGTTALLGVLEATKATKGEHYRSKIINHLAFGTFNNRIKNLQTSYDWLTSDMSIVNRYRSDEKCKFIFTVNGFENLVRLMWFVSNDKWYSHVRKDLPVYLIAGDCDPVGDYGKGVREVYDRLDGQCCNVRMKLHKDCRHELTNEYNRYDVYEDIYSFITENMMER